MLTISAIDSGLQKCKHCKRCSKTKVLSEESCENDSLQTHSLSCLPPVLCMNRQERPQSLGELNIYSEVGVQGLGWC